MGSSPAFQFYTGDWLKTAALSKCEPAVRGIWIDLCCAAWDADDEGRVSGTIRELSRVARCAPEEMAEAIAAFQRHDVADVSQDGEVFTIVSRRIRKQLAAMHSNRDRVRKHRKRKAECNADVTPDVMDEKRACTEEGRLKSEVEEEKRGKSAEKGEKRRGAVAVFRDITGYDPPVVYADQIAHYVKRVDIWEAVVQRWVDSGYQKTNVPGMLEWYQDETTPRAAKGTSRNSRPDADPVINAHAIAKLAGAQ